jgi:hypothetical protein
MKVNCVGFYSKRSERGQRNEGHNEEVAMEAIC